MLAWLDCAKKPIKDFLNTLQFGLPRLSCRNTFQFVPIGFGRASQGHPLGWTLFWLTLRFLAAASPPSHVQNGFASPFSFLISGLALSLQMGSNFGVYKSESFGLGEGVWQAGGLQKVAAFEPSALLHTCMPCILLHTCMRCIHLPPDACSSYLRLCAHLLCTR